MPISLESPLPVAQLREALDAAWWRRDHAGLGVETTAYRVVHRQFDALAGLTIDRLGDVAWVVYRNAGYAASEAVEATVAALRPHGIERFVWRYDRPGNQGDDPYESEANAEQTLQRLGVGFNAETTIATESGLRYEFASDRGLSHGLFFDMRDVRRDLRERWSGRRVLNLFAYTCDVTKRYLEWGKRNFALNEMDAPATGFVAKDAFSYLEVAAKLGNRFDAIVLDPPTFSHGKKGKARRFSIPSDLDELMALALGALNPNGELFVGTNAAQLARDSFSRLCRDRASHVGRRVVQTWRPAPDFPVSPSEYHLKTALIA
jgi:23S rRNA (cytosine1962-C5)-methyltransferase